jgi:4,5:9,10-diseco-3-hydroxy-5,9,17-trioxoandrosta-1(10),2-diene-4-oate hydrolase
MTTQLYEDQYVNVGGINTRFWTAGDQGDIIILVHGITNSIDLWAGNMPALAENHRVYAMDLPGFGLTDKIPMKTPSQGARFIDDFMKTQNIDKATLIGHSLGGGFVLQYAILYPDKVSRLVLISSLGFGQKTHLFFKLLSLPVIGDFLSRPSRSGTKKSLSTAVYNQSVVTDELVETLYRFSALPGYQKCLLSVVRSGGNLRGLHPDLIRPIMENLSAIKAPTLIIWGKEDSVFPVDNADVALKNIPNARLKVFERCGHVAHLEYPDEFNSLVTEFLAE